MLKKCTAIFCLMSIIMQLFCFSASATVTADSETRADILIKLDITDKKTPSKITRNFAVESLMGFIYDKDMKTAENEDFARTYGFIEKTEKYSGTQTVSVNEVLEYCVKILGYGSALPDATDKIYVNTAVSLGIAKGVTGKYESAVTYSDFVQILYNMLEQEPIIMKGIQQGKAVYELASDKTVMSLNRDIYKIKGIQTGNEVTSIYSSQGAGNGRISIDGITYFYAGSEDFIGRKIEAFIKEDKYNDSEVLCIRDIGEDVLEIDGGDIKEIAADFSTVKYYDEKDRNKTVKISDTPKVIFNGVFYGAYTAADLKPNVGKIELIDNNSDGYYEVIKVTSYEIMMVSGVDEYNGIISNSLSYTGSAASLDVSKFDDELMTIYRNGKKADLSAIEANDILDVAASKDGKMLEIIATDNSLTGGCTSLDNSERIVCIDGSEYEYSVYLDEIMSAKGVSLSIGQQYTFHFDSFDTVVFCEKIKSDGYYVYLKCLKDSDDKPYIKCMDLEGNWSKIFLRKKVNINGTNYETERAYEELRGITPQVVMLAISGDGEVKKFTTATETAVVDKEKFTKQSYSSKRYHTPTTFANTVYLATDAKVVLIPQNALNADKYTVYKPSEILTNEKSYTFTAYNLDKYGFTDLITIIDDANLPSAGNGGQWFIVSGKETVLENDEAVQAIKGCYGGFLDISFTEAESGILSSVSPGDVLDITLNTVGQVKKINSKKYDMSRFTEAVDSDFYQNHNVVLAGRINDMDLDGGRILLDCGTYGLRAFRLNSSMIVKCYNTGDHSIRLTNVKSLKKGDEIICRMEYGTIQEMIMREG